jgi:pSer/pThr/pTyr-binding forkhead associated (FHA) protein
MARLLIKSEGFDEQVIELKLGVNRLGRRAGNDFQIEHATVSTRHCEVVLGQSQVVVRDCESTNGTFLNDQRIKEARLLPGQSLRLGDVELFVETLDVNIAIPKFEVSPPAPPVMFPNGLLPCPRHPQSPAAYQCTHCKEMICEACVHRLRRSGGKLLKLCPKCSYPVVRLGAEPKKKRGFLAFLQKTVKLSFIRQRPKR